MENKKNIYSYDSYYIKQNIDMLSRFINEYKNNTSDCNYYFEIPDNTQITTKDIQEFIKLIYLSGFELDTKEQVIYNCKIRDNEYLKITICKVITYPGNIKELKPLEDYYTYLYKVKEDEQKITKLGSRVLLGYKSFNKDLVKYLAKSTIPSLIESAVYKERISKKYLSCCDNQKILNKILTTFITGYLDKIKWDYEELKGQNIDKDFLDKYLMDSKVNINNMHKALILLVEAENQLENAIKGNYIKPLGEFTEIINKEISRWWWR